jgi:hypothetical protein
MIISHKHKFIYIKTRKTASTSLALFFSQFCGENDIVPPAYEFAPGKGDVNSPRNYRGIFNPVPEMRQQMNLVIHNKKAHIHCSSNAFKDALRRRKFYGHIPAYQLKERLPHKIWLEYYKFCFERNPWDKTVSWFFYCNNVNSSNLTFDEYIRETNLPYNYPLYTNPSDNREVIVDHVGKYEYLNDELENICIKLGIPFKGKLEINALANYRDKRKAYQDYFINDQSMELIRSSFAPEIKLNNYDFN